MAQRDLRKESASESESLLSRYPLHLTGLAALAWLISLLIIPSFVLGLEALGVLRTSPDDLLPLSDKRLWGGLMLTMQLTILGIVAAFPIGLAFGAGEAQQADGGQVCLHPVHRNRARCSLDHRALYGDLAATADRPDFGIGGKRGARLGRHHTV